MTKDSFLRALKGFSSRKPFRPFEIEFTTGERLLITHPEIVVPHPKRELIVYMDGKHRYRLFDCTIVQLLDPMD